MVYDPRLLPGKPLADALTYIAAPTGTGAIGCDPERVGELSETDAKDILARVMRMARAALTSTDEMSLADARATLRLVQAADGHHPESADEGPLADTVAVDELMRAFGHPVRARPTADLPAEERVLWARLVLDEAVEFVEAMGCVAVTPGHDVVDSSVEVTAAGGRRVDLVEATDALGDLIVVTKGSALTLGVPIDAASEVIHASNMAKVGPDGVPERSTDGKVIKPDGWQPPTARLATLLRAHGWSG